MSRSLIVVDKNTTAAEAHKLMASHWIRHLPVVDESGDYVVGMLSERDLLRSPSPETRVFNLMSAPLKTFDAETPIHIVVNAMVDEKMSAFVITNEDEIMGIVTSEDMLMLLSKILSDEPSTKWVLSEFLVNPLFQRTVNLASQAGI